ncbi:hypothetical protein KBB92_01925 [Candidatus Shapirobacteria bacterium]|nr:hypothetical protein [Candidatus Shapirobacteria bacterium]
MELFKKENKTIENSAQTYFNLIEWLIILATLRFVELKTESYFVRQLVNIGLVLWILFIARLFFPIIKRIIERLFINNSVNTTHNTPIKFYIIPIIVAFLIGGMIGATILLLVLEVVDRLLVSF